MWGASWLASRVASSGADKGHPTAAGNAVFNAALIGLLAARLAHLGLNADLYAATPWSAFDVRDGGWHVPTGVDCGCRVVGVARLALRRRCAGHWPWVAWRGWCSGSPHRPPPAWASARQLPALVFSELDGAAQLSLSQAARGRPVVVNLWASWCGPCRQEMPMLAAAQQRESVVGFLFVNQGESDSAVRAYLTDQGLPLREVLLDAGSKLGPAVGSRGLPTTLFYDARGRLVDAHFGVLNAAALESRLRQLRATQ